MSCMCKREREGKRARGGTVVACQVITLLHGELHFEAREKERERNGQKSNKRLCFDLAW